MENKICVLTEASDTQIHLTRTAIYSFLETNKWFDGTIHLAVHPNSQLSDKNLSLLNSIYSKINLVSPHSSPILLHITSQKKSHLQFEIIQTSLKTLAFGLPENKILYFSNSSLFLKDVSSILKENSLITVDENCSLFYTSLLDSSDLFHSILENIQFLSIFSKDSINSAILSGFQSISEYLEDSSGFYRSSYFSNKKFNQLKTILNRAKCLNFDSMHTNRVETSKINAIWIQKNQTISNFLNKPTVSNPDILKSLKSQSKLRNGTQLNYSTTRHDTQRLNTLFGNNILLDRSSAMKYFSNKSICIVANSSELLNYDYGAFIDSHDIVIRFNGYKIIPEKTGTKTDVHCVFREYFGRSTPVAPIKLIISKSRSQWLNSLSSFHVKDAAYRKYQIIDFNYPSDHDMKKANCEDINLPTSGLCLFVYLVSLGLSDRIRLVGFNGYNSGDSNSILRDNDDPTLAPAHNYQMESKYWASHFNQILPGVLKIKS